jgi:3-deoxy-7-phosphoheptulonate synthase
MVEVHYQPEKALSDGAQSLYPGQFARLVLQVQAIYAAFNRLDEAIEPNRLER